MVDYFFSHEPGELVKIVIVDGEGCNGLMKRAIFGQISSAFRKRLDGLQWFSRLKHVSLAGVEDWPRCPIKACKLDDQWIYAMPATAHSQKNSCGQLQSNIRVLYFGNFFADVSGALANSLPVPAFVRRDTMSDRLAALLCNPLFMVCDRDPWCISISCYILFDLAGV